MKPRIFSPLRAESGQAIVLIALVLTGLIAMTGLVVDGGLTLANRRQAQNAADSAAMAAALARIRGGNYTAAALEQLQANGFESGEQNDVQVFNPPINGPYAGNREYIQIILTTHQPTVFGRVVGFGETTNTVQAVARAKPAEVTQMLDGFAVVSLAPLSDCQSNKAFWAHGEGTLEIEGGGVWVNSNNPACAFLQQGNGSLVFDDNSPFVVVGGASIQKPQLIKRQTSGLGYMQKESGIPFLPNVGAIPLPYPPPFILPKPSCDKTAAAVKEDGKTMSPGYWDEDFPPKGVSTLEPGVYCINGDVRINGNQTLQGTNVVLYVESGEVHFNGDATINLDAPQGGPYQGLLIYLPMDNDSIITLNGNAQSRFTGTILAPASLIRINGNASSYGFHSQIIGYTIELTGNSNVRVKYLDSQNYDALVSPEIEFKQ